MIECWQKNNYLYSDLEEMYLINMQSNQDRQLLVRELVSTIGGNRLTINNYMKRQDVCLYFVWFFQNSIRISAFLLRRIQIVLVYILL